MLASEARSEALQLHAEIRSAVARMLEAAGRIQRGEPASQSGLFEAFVSFESVALRHLALEDRDALPYIEIGDAWGPMRREQLEAAHASQRQAIEHARDLLGASPLEGRVLVEAIEKLGADVLSSLSSVERDLFGPSILRDNTVTADQETG